jgi:hypothetical protein
VKYLFRRARAADGFALVEVIGVMSILVTVVTLVTALVTSGAKAEIELSDRLQAQQEARLALDRMRGELRCGDSLTLTSASAFTVSLPAACPTSGGVNALVTYDVQAVAGAAGRFQLRRSGTVVADFLATANAFSYIAPSATTLGRLGVDLRVNVRPSDPTEEWRLQDAIALRNTVRA